MKLKRKINVCAFALLGVGASLSAAKADLRYTVDMAASGPGATGANGSDSAKRTPTMQMTTWNKGHDERTEMNVSFGAIQTKSVTLTLCEKQQTIRMDPDLKIYTVGPIGAMNFAPPSRPGRPTPQPTEQQPGEGKVVMTYAVQDMGNEKIGDLDTHHSMVTIEHQTSGCLGEHDTKMKLEVWVAAVKRYFCPERFAASRVVPNAQGCQITYEMKGDTEAMRTAFSGLMVRQKYYNNDKVVMEQDLKDFSEADLDDSLFAAPADYKQLSAADYDSAESKAMTSRFLNGGTAGAGDSSSPDNTNSGPPPKKKRGPFGIPLP